MDQQKTQEYFKIIHELHIRNDANSRKVDLNNPEVIQNLIPILLEISFDGSWRDVLSYIPFGSWLDSDIAEVFSKAKEKFGKTIYEYLEEFGRNKTYGEWKNVIAEYPLLPIKCYKQEIDFEVENIKSILPIENEFGRKAWIELNQEWLKTIVRKVSFPDGTSFKEKFSAYLTSQYFPIALNLILEIVCRNRIQKN